MFKNLYFIGGVAAALVVAVLGISLVSAATNTAPGNTTNDAVKSACGCGQAAKCKGNCAGATGTGSCGCGQKGAGFVDANKNGICDKME